VIVDGASGRVDARRWCTCQSALSSKDAPVVRPEILFRDVLRLGALGFEIVGHSIGAIGTFVRCQAEHDEPQPRARKGRIQLMSEPLQTARTAVTRPVQAL